MARALRELISDFDSDPGNWELVQTDVQPSLNKRDIGGSSVQETFRHKTTGEEMVRHTVYNANGKVFRPPHFPIFEVKEGLMPQLDNIDWEILNATADDCENLEEVYLTVCFECRVENSQEPESTLVFRRLSHAPLLSELADRIRMLVETGLLTAVANENGDLPNDSGELTNVWRCWFAMTARGMQVWKESPPSLVEQETSQ